MTINRNPSYSPSDSPSYSSSSLLFCDDPITPYTLFANGAQGIFLDPSNFSTLFQDAAGTIPVTKLGQNVGKILDLSGRGNHVVQATAASRWTIQARNNQFTATEFPNGVTDAPGRGGLVTATTLAGYDGALAFGHDGSTVSYAYKPGAVAGVVYTISCVVKMDDGNAPTFGSATPSAASNTFGFVIAGSGQSPLTYTVTAIGGGYYRVSSTGTAGASVTNNGIVKYNTNNNRTFVVTAYSLTAGNLLSSYQKVNTATDYTDIGLSPYLELDGTDDSAATAAIVDFSATDTISIWSGVRKERDATAIVMELGPDASANAGTFFVSAPDTAADNFGARSGGTVSAALSQYGHPAPKTALLFAQSKISTDFLSLSVNGGTPTTTAADQGTGNYSATQKLFFGRRNNTSLPFKGRLYAQVVYSGLVSEAEQKQISKWFYARMPAV